MIKKLSSDKAPAAIGPYSQAVKCGNMIYTSGQIPLDPETGNIVEGGIREQSERIMKNLEALLKEAGTDFDSVVKTTCFIKDMADFAVFNEVYAKYFTNSPARSCVAVKELPKGALAEVEVIALTK